MSGYSKTGLVLIILLQVLLSTFGGTGAAYYYQNKKIYPGIEGSGVPLGGLDYSTAGEKLRQELPPIFELTFFWNGNVYSLPLYSGVYDYLVDEAVEKALSLSTPFTGRLVENMTELCRGGAFFNIIRWRPCRQSFQVPLAVSPSFLLNELRDLRAQIDREPQNANIAFEKGVPFYLEERLGAKLDLEKSKAVIEGYLAEGITKQVPLWVDVVLPQVRREHLPDFSQCLASYETSLSGDNNNNRNHNIKLASESLNGLILEPDQIISFNELLGPATKEKGFLEAPVFQNRKLVSGVGGGLCQVATTLYQAALRAELEIVERSSHSRPVAYVPLGQDATISYHLIDLKIKNNKEYPLIFTNQINGSLLFSIFGAEKDPARNVEIFTEDVEIIRPELLEHHNPNLPKGTRRQHQKGEEGYRVKVYRLVYEDGIETSRELISTDYYPPINEIIHVGVKEIPHVKK